MSKNKVIKKKNIKGKNEAPSLSAHVPSEIHPDTLFTFTDKLSYLITYLKDKKIPARYCTEDMRYIRSSKFKALTFPMKCFCDININKLDVHMNWYGYYGIAFSKEWGMDRDFQPVHYINTSNNCSLFLDLKDTVKTMFKDKREDNDQFKDYCLHELLYTKPYQGNMKNRNTDKVEEKCFTDECEWRFIPDITKCNLKLVFHSELDIYKLNLLNDILRKENSANLKFKYSDIKHIIIKSLDDYKTLFNEIDELSTKNKVELLSKVIVWEENKKDF